LRAAARPMPRAPATTATFPENSAILSDLLS
jgi:hypothetical protein